MPGGWRPPRLSLTDPVLSACFARHAIRQSVTHLSWARTLVPAPAAPGFLNRRAAVPCPKNTVSGVGAACDSASFGSSEGTENSTAPNVPKLGGLVTVVNNR